MKVAVAIFSLMLLVIFLFWYFLPPQESRYTRQRIPLPEEISPRQTGSVDQQPGKKIPE